MNRDQLKSLKVGDRVKYTSLAGASYGTVVERVRGVVKIAWDDQGGTWFLNPRAKFDRERALRIEVVTPVAS